MLTARTTWSRLVAIAGDASASTTRAQAYPQLVTTLPNPLGNGVAAALSALDIRPDLRGVTAVAAGPSAFHFSARRRETPHRVWLPGESASRCTGATCVNRHVRGRCENVKSLVGGISAVACGASSSPNSSGTGEFPYPFTTN